MCAEYRYTRECDTCTAGTIHEQFVCILQTRVCARVSRSIYIKVFARKIGKSEESEIIFMCMYKPMCGVCIIYNNTFFTGGNGFSIVFWNYWMIHMRLSSFNIVCTIHVHTVYIRRPILPTCTTLRTHSYTLRRFHFIYTCCLC